jgi:predicted GIY-YIG superfamily endonuclease
MSFFAYIVECDDQTFYVGSTDDLDRRIAQHEAGEGSEWTRSRLPVKLVWSESFMSRDEALTIERQLKGWSRAKKIALIDGDLSTVSILSHRGSNPQPSTLALRDADRRSAPQDDRHERNAS